VTLKGHTRDVGPQYVTASRHPSGASNLEVAPDFLNVCGSLTFAKRVS
jgi:hypothetical protein